MPNTIVAVPYSGRATVPGGTVLMVFDEAISVHSLRVTAATEAHRAKVPLVDIQHWLGHKDPRTTLRYIRGVEDVDNSPAYILRYG